jgi:hypothetical protein
MMTNCSLFEQMKLDLATKLSDHTEKFRRDMEAMEAGRVQRENHQREREYIDHTVKYIDTCTDAGGSVIPKSKPNHGGLGAVVAPAAAVRGSRGHYDPGGGDSGVPMRAAPFGERGTPGGGVQGDPQPGYPPERINVQKHEMSEIGTFLGGEEARKKWPGFHANFKHLADSYDWNYHTQGVVLARKCRGLALPVINSLPEKMRKDYNSIVAVFNKAYVPKEWARTYHGA